MKKLIILVVIIAALGGLAVTCPNREAHVQKLTEVSGEVSKELTGTQKGILGSIVSTVSKAAFNVAGSQLVVVDNYGICSVGKIHNPSTDEDQIITLGIAGKVFPLASAKTIAEKIKE